MKICHTLLCMNPGGAENVVATLSNYWVNDNKELKIIKKKPNLKNFLLPHNYPYKLSKKEEIIEIIQINRG